MPDKVRNTIFSVLFIAHARHSSQLHKAFGRKAAKVNKIKN